jgi:hypothetical protein
VDERNIFKKIFIKQNLELSHFIDHRPNYVNIEIILGSAKYRQFLSPMGEVVNLKDKSGYREFESCKAFCMPVLTRGFIETYTKAPFWTRTSIC